MTPKEKLSPCTAWGIAIETHDENIGHLKELTRVLKMAADRCLASEFHTNPPEIFTMEIIPSLGRANIQAYFPSRELAERTATMWRKAWQKNHAELDYRIHLFATQSVVLASWNTRKRDDEETTKNRLYHIQKKWPEVSIEPGIVDPTGVHQKSQKISRSLFTVKVRAGGEQGQKLFGYHAMKWYGENFKALNPGQTHDELKMHHHQGCLGNPEIISSSVMDRENLLHESASNIPCPKAPRKRL